MPEAGQLKAASWSLSMPIRPLSRNCCKKLWFVYCLKSAFEEVGGFSKRVYAAEEYFFSRALKKWGRKRGLEFKIITDHPVVTSNRKAEWFTPRQMIFQMCLITVAPFLLTSRRFCGMWYKRPANSKEN